MPQLKLGNIRVIFSSFKNCTRCEKYSKDNKHNSFHFCVKMCSSTCPWTSSFPRAQSFPRAMLSVNCRLLRPDNVRGLIAEHVFCARWLLLLIYSALALTFSRVHPSSNLFVFVSRERLFLVFMSPSASRATLTEVMVPTSGKGRLCDCTLQRITNLQTNNQ